MSYARSYRGIPLSGGEVVVATDAAGRTVCTGRRTIREQTRAATPTSVAQDRAAGSKYLLQDSSYTTLKCRDAANNRTDAAARGCPEC